MEGAFFVIARCSAGSGSELLGSHDTVFGGRVCIYPDAYLRPWQERFAFGDLCSYEGLSFRFKLSYIIFIEFERCPRKGNCWFIIPLPKTISGILSSFVVDHWFRFCPPRYRAFSSNRGPFCRYQRKRSIGRPKKYRIKMVTFHFYSI